MDLIVAPNRQDADRLWIPNTEKNDWGPSHREKHTELSTRGTQALRTTRARAIRLGGQRTSRTRDSVLCSFNVETFGPMFIDSGMSVATALAALWRKGAADLDRRLTPDPAGVSAPSRSPTGKGAGRRLE